VRKEQCDRLHAWTDSFKTALAAKFYQRHEAGMLQSGVHSIGRNTLSNLPDAWSGKVLQDRDNIIAIISTLASL
jgi:hypothetical protein